MLSTNKSNPFFIPSLIGLCVCYLAIVFLYNHYAMLSVDEFWFAHRIYQYKDGLPYRDFAPYKTILGYYLLLPPMLSDRGILQTLTFTKDSIAVLNMLILFASSLWLTRFFSRAGILLSLAILIFAEIVISYSTQLRVDLLGYWLCFFSLLLLLEKRYLLAGLLIGLGFATTQKAIWYIFAGNCALAVLWLVCQRDIKTIKNIALFNLASVGVIALYLVFWSWISDWNTVINSVFHEASAMYRLDWYTSTRKLFWQNITLCNPLIFILWPMTLISLFVTYEGDKSYPSRLFIVTYAIVILLCLIPYKQVFPYYMQVTIPVIFAMYAAFITWLIDIFHPNHVLRLSLNRFSLWVILALYLIGIVYLSIQLDLPEPYLLICLIPISLITYITTAHRIQRETATLLFQLIMITAVFMGLIYPLTQVPMRMEYLNNRYQQANVHAVDVLLQDGGDYVAGIELIYNKTQPIAGMRHLMGPAVSYLYAPTPKLKEVMLASLYEDPNATIDSVIQAFKQSSVKFYVNNYRMNVLPNKIKQYLDSEYAHWWGSIYLYAPLVAKGTQSMQLKFAGKYLIESASNHYIELNGNRYSPHSIVELKKGYLNSNADSEYRLKLIPANEAVLLNPEFKDDEWSRVMF